MKQQQLKKPLALSFAIASATFTANTLAAGFQINEHSAASLGRALAGESAIAEDASAIAHNPALAGFFDSAHLSAGFSYIAPDVSARGEVTNPLASGLSQSNFVQSADANDVAPDAVVPNAYYVRPITDSVAFGLTLNSHFGLSTDYGDNYVASDIANLAEIRSININPSLSYKVSEQFFVGFGVSFVYADGHLKTSFANYENQILQGVATQLNTAQAGQGEDVTLSNNVLAELEGDDLGFGFNFGAAYKPTESITIGLNYRSEVDLQLSGESSTDLEELGQLSPAFSDANDPNGRVRGTLAQYQAAAFLDDNDALLDISLPAITEIGIAWEMTGDIKLSAGATHIGWSSVPEIAVSVAQAQDPVVLEELEWDDTWRYALAGAYKATDDLTLRVGYAIDESPTNDQHRTLAIPDGDRTWLSAGATYAFSETMSVDFGYAFIDGDEQPVEQTSRLGGSFTGTVEGDAQVFALSFNYAL